MSSQNKVMVGGGQSNEILTSLTSLLDTPLIKASTKQIFEQKLY